MRCSECGSSSFAESKGEIACTSCGLIIEDNLIDHDALIPIGNHASHLALAEAGTFNTSGRIVKESWLETTRKKNYRSMCREIDILQSRVYFSENAAIEAKRYLLEAMRNDLEVGRNYLDITYACVYIACRSSGTPRTVLEITARSIVTRKGLQKAEKLLLRKLQLPGGGYDAVDLIPRFATRLQLSSEAVTLALEIASTSRIPNAKPATVAAASLYAAMKLRNERRPQRFVTKYTGVVEPTIRRRSRLLLAQFHSK